MFVRVKTPSRLHLALIDLNGSLGRVDGSVGVALRRPGFEIELRRAEKLRIEGEGAELFRDRIRHVFDRLRERFDIGGMEVRIGSYIPPHCGLGSGTQISLAIAYGAASLYGIELSDEEAPLLVGRGGTSGIGVAAFRRGGFIVDGGHRFPDQKSSFLPSSAFEGVPPPPVLLRTDFPEEWRILVVIPPGRHISGEEEVGLFKRLCPIPACDVERLCRVILIEMLPALVERDLERFADAINRVQEIGWKRIEVEAQEEVVRETMRFLRENGALGVGLSSWGPALYALSDDPEGLLERVGPFLQARGGTCILTEADNCGAVVERIERSGRGLSLIHI